jgi:hypothetical protein
MWASAGKRNPIHSLASFLASGARAAKGMPLSRRCPTGGWPFLDAPGVMPPVIVPLKRHDPHHIAKDFQKLDHVLVSFAMD